MWMLMEGVVLYLVLVKVFVKHQIKRNIIGFTISSYGRKINASLDSYNIKSIVYAGIPFLYMLVVVPLGFLVNTDSTGHHYGQHNAQNGQLLVYVYMHVQLHYLAKLCNVYLIIDAGCDTTHTLCGLSLLLSFLSFWLVFFQISSV